MVTTTDRRIEGWDAIAKAAGKATKRSISERTARRWAQPDRHNRLPVFIFPNKRVYMLKSHLDLWANAFVDPMPIGGLTPATMIPVGVVKRKARAASSASAS